ncbi:hypothetical protein LI328DRAFT_119050 [Trichoderma asperelloides]|nr:hypothetical protein LI328DRAFT_119050 [Trichoderma asperelloides]
MFACLLYRGMGRELSRDMVCTFFCVSWSNGAGNIRVMDISFLCCPFYRVFLFELFSFFSTTGITCAYMSFFLNFYFFSCMAIFYIIDPLLIYNK